MDKEKEVIESIKNIYERKNQHIIDLTEEQLKALGFDREKIERIIRKNGVK